MRKIIETGIIGAVVAIGMLAAGTVGRQDKPTNATFEVDEFLITPVRVHLMRLNDTAGVGTKLKVSDIERVFRKANGIWHSAGVHLWLESVVEERPRGRTDSDSERINHFRQLMELRPASSLAEGMFHVYFIGRMSINGLYVDRDALFVQEAASLTPVPGGIDEPLPRVMSHELGHALTLRHRQDLNNLMASGTTGASLNQAEVHIARRAAESLAWILPTTRFLDSADKLSSDGKGSKPDSRYRAVASLPGVSPLKERALAALRSASN